MPTPVCGLLLQSWCLHFLQQGLSYTHSQVTGLGRVTLEMPETAAGRGDGRGDLVSENASAASSQPVQQREAVWEMAENSFNEGPTFTPALVLRALNPACPQQCRQSPRGAGNTLSPGSVLNLSLSVFSNCVGLGIPAWCPLLLQASGGMAFFRDGQ